MQRILLRLDSLAFWVAAAYFLLVLSLGVGAVSFWRASEARDKTVKAEAVTEAEHVAAQQRCLGSIPLLNRVNVYVGGVSELSAVLLANSVAELNETPLESPMRAVRAENLRRLIQSVKDIADFGGFDVPTRQECLRR